jgi:outer membrane protein TolC
MLRYSISFLFSGFWLFAAEPASASALSLDDAIRVAWQNDLHAAALALAPELARAREVQAGFAPPPVLDLRASVPAAGDSEWSAGVGVSRTFARRERLELARAYARLGAEATEHQLYARRLELADNVRRLVYELAVSEARSAVARRAVDSLRELERALNARHTAGEVAGLDLELVALEVARAEQGLALADAESLGWRTRLRQRLRSPEADFAPGALALEALLARPTPVVSANEIPTLALADLARREADAALLLAQSESRAEWTLGAGFDVERRANDATGRLDTTPVLGVSASRPWPGVVSNRGVVQEKRAELRLAEARRAALCDDVAAELNAALAVAEAARAALARHCELRERASALPAKFEAAFTRGEITAPQWAQARQQVHAVEADFLAAAARYLALLADAEATVGVLPDPQN